MTVGMGATDEVAERIDEVFIMSGLTIMLTRLGGSVRSFVAEWKMRREDEKGMQQQAEVKRKRYFEDREWKRSARCL